MQADRFAADAVFVATASEQVDLLKEIYQLLEAADYVKSGSLGAVIRREAQYPTGINTGNLDKNLPNVALPHFAGKFVNQTLLVPVKLEEPVVFGQFVRPQEQVAVSFLFVLLSASSEGQAQLQAQVIDFLAHTPAKQLQTLFKLHDPAAIYAFLEQRF